MELVIYGDKILESPADDIIDFSAKAEVISDMFDVMYEHKGVGLAAPQVGLAWRLFVYDDRSGFKGYMFNPFIRRGTSQTLLNEGCLSFPGLYLHNVRRSKKIIVKGVDVQGKGICHRVSGLAAQIIQHEVDHLDGMLFVDRSTGTNQSQKIFEDWKQSLDFTN